MRQEYKLDENDIKIAIAYWMVNGHPTNQGGGFAVRLDITAGYPSRDPREQSGPVVSAIASYER